MQIPSNQAPVAPAEAGAYLYDVLRFGWTHAVSALCRAVSQHWTDMGPCLRRGDGYGCGEGYGFAQARPRGVASAAPAMGGVRHHGRPSPLHIFP